MELHHLVLSTRGREPLLLETAARRAALRVIVRVIGGRLWLFGVADDHLHLLARDPKPSVLIGHVALALRALPGAPELQAGHVEPVTERSHLRRLVPYVIRQSEHHGLGPTATWEGSCFADLVGARRLEGFDPEAWRAGLPREDRRLVWEAAGMAPPRAVALEGQPLAALIGAACRVVGAAPTLAGRDALAVRARRLGVALAREGAYAAGRVAEALACTPRNVAKLEAAGCDAGDLEAARLWIAIEAAVRGS